jgi:hypothetical protein
MTAASSRPLPFPDPSAKESAPVELTRKPPVPRQQAPSQATTQAPVTLAAADASSHRNWEAVYGDADKVRGG